jgi:hypothetical protein
MVNRWIEAKEGALIALDAWEAHTRPIVAAAYGEGEATHVFTPELKGGRIYYGTDLLRANMERPPPKAEAINNLKALLGRMSDLALRADFDPADWRPFDYTSFREVNARPIRQLGDPEWTCPWCLHEHQYWSGHCVECRAERVGEYLFPRRARERRSLVQLSPLEIWLAERVARADEFQSQRTARSDGWFFEEMGKWDVENVSQMIDGPSPVAPDLVVRYREDPRTGNTDGLAVATDGHSLVDGERERYYGQRVAWMRAVLNKLGNAQEARGR